MRLTTRQALPEGLLDCPAAGLLDALGGPTLFDLSRGLPDPLFVTVLQHGNEVSGWDAVRAFLHGGSTPPMLLYVANVAAASAGRRTLAGQRQTSTGPGNGGRHPGGAPRPTGDATARWQAPPRLAVDIHNNTGTNPHYSVLTDLGPRCLGAAAAFSPLALLAQHRDGIQTERFTKFCPAITIETGVVGEPASAARTTDYLTRAVRWREAPEASFSDLTVYRNQVRIVIEEADADFTSPAVLVLREDLEQYNFACLEAGNLFARRDRSAAGAGLRAVDVTGADLTDFYFEIHDAELRLRQPVYLSMYTRDIDIARQDCLCYFMSPLPHP